MSEIRRPVARDAWRRVAGCVSIVGLSLLGSQGMAPADLDPCAPQLEQCTGAIPAKALTVAPRSARTTPLLPLAFEECRPQNPGAFQARGSGYSLTLDSRQGPVVSAGFGHRSIEGRRLVVRGRDPARRRPQARGCRSRPLARLRESLHGNGPPPLARPCPALRERPLRGRLRRHRGDSGTSSSTGDPPLRSPRPRRSAASDPDRPPVGPSGPRARFSIDGPLCTALDSLGSGVLAPLPRPGDIVVAKKAGAYGFTESMPLFLSHEWPAEIGVRGERAARLRAAPTVDSLIARQTAPTSLLGSSRSKAFLDARIRRPRSWGSSQTHDTIERTRGRSRPEKKKPGPEPGLP